MPMGSGRTTSRTSRVTSQIGRRSLGARDRTMVSEAAMGFRLVNLGLA